MALLIDSFTGFAKLFNIFVFSVFITVFDTFDAVFLIEFATLDATFFTLVIGASIKDDMTLTGGELDALVFRLILIDISIEYLRNNVSVRHD